MTEPAVKEVKLPPESEPFHKAIATKAEGILRDLVDDNGMKGEQLRLTREEVTIYKIPANLTFKLKPEVQKATVRGRAPRGIACGSETEVFGRAEGLAQEMQKGLDIQNEITQSLSKDAGRGFGLKILAIPMPGAQKEFSVVYPCLKCHGAQVVPCLNCQSTGQAPCMTCHGDGTYQCPTCFGTGRVHDANNNYVGCGRCQHTGRLPCPHCNGTKHVVCGLCHGQGRTACTECAQTGYSTDVFQIDYKAHFQFDVDWKEVPREVQDVVHKLGIRELATENHAEIIWTPMQVRAYDILIPGVAFLPIAKAEYSVEGKIYPALVTGLQGRVYEIEPVLDEAVKPGIRALMKLSKGPLARQALIDTACKYKLIRQVLAYTARRYSKKAAYQYLTKHYPLLLSEKYAKATVIHAHKALEAISTAPRYKGLVLGTVIAAALAAGYYFTRARYIAQVLLSQRDLIRFIPGVDAFVWLLGLSITIYMIKVMAAAAFKKVLPDTVDVKKAGLPAAGNQGLMAFPLTLVICLALAFLAPQRPEWIEQLMQLR